MAHRTLEDLIHERQELRHSLSQLETHGHEGLEIAAAGEGDFTGCRLAVSEQFREWTFAAARQDLRAQIDQIEGRIHEVTRPEIRTLQQA